MFDWAAVRGRVMGIVNVTPDSFSDGGRHLDPDAAIEHGVALVGHGAAVLDVGGESTRPGAAPVDAVEESRRVVPVIRALASAVDVPISIDTTKAVVAAQALEAGATIVNDVSAGRHDPDLLGVVAAARAGYVVMHMQGEPRTMQHDPQYDDVVHDVGAFLVDRLAAARAAGIADGALMADPGIGFGKTAQHNLELLAPAFGARRAREGSRARRRVARRASSGSCSASMTQSVETTPRSPRWSGPWSEARRWCGCTRCGARCRPRPCSRRSSARPCRRWPRERLMAPLRGRWAQGLEPRMFCWIVKDRLAASERPGGFARNHRKIRRQEELIWLAQHDFTRVLSLLDSTHNLHAYDEAGIEYEHIPLGRHDELGLRLPLIYEAIARRLDVPGERILVHHEEFGERLLGVLGGYLIYSGLVAEGPNAIVVVERLTGHELGAIGREIVAITIDERLVRSPRAATDG